MSKSSNILKQPGSGDFSPELVPVVEPGAPAWALPQPAVAADEVALGDLLSDVLFGEVIDISDIIPHLMSPSAGAAALGIPATDVAEEIGLADGGDAIASAGHAALTILYDDDILASDGTI